MGPSRGGIYAWHRPNLAVRIGGYRPRIVVLSLPGFALLIAAVVLGSFLPVVAAIVVVGSAILLAVVSHDRYVAAITDDRLIATWVWQRPQEGIRQPMALVGSGIVLAALLLGLFTDRHPLQQLYLAFLGALFLWMGYADSEAVVETADIGLPELHVYDAGLVIDGTIFARLVPWRSITGVRVTADTVVIERRWWFDVRCDRERIDDAEHVREAIRRRCS